MKTSAFSGLILGSTILVAALSFPSTLGVQDCQKLLSDPAQMQRADGGRPVPPLPPPAFVNALTADGGRPVPPLPPPSAARSSFIQQSPLLADGGGPVPPLPPPALLNTLTADGGGPVPPLPPPFLSPELAAV